MLCGRDSRDMSLGEIGKKIGYIFQDPERQLFAPTVFEELSFVMELTGEKPGLIKKRVEEMLLLFELNSLRDSFPFQLSRGEKQRLALAAVLINQPEYIIMDEPTTGLDVKRMKKLLQLLKRLQKDEIGLLVISHDHHYFKDYADQMLRLDRGVIEVESAL